MRSHPYLRAYMAGITFPTLFLLLVLTVVIALRRLGGLAVPIEHFAVFPMALVPNSWGLWNMLRVASAGARQIAIGGYGALLAVLLPVLGYSVAVAVGVELPTPGGGALVAWLVAILLYYLVWKHLVGFLNELLGISG